MTDKEAENIVNAVARGDSYLRSLADAIDAHATAAHVVAIELAKVGVRGPFGDKYREVLRAVASLLAEHASDACELATKIAEHAVAAG